jgi:mannosyltransferase
MSATRHATAPRPDPQLAWAVVALLMLLFALLCGVGLDGIPLWNDEAFSFFVAWQDVAHTLAFMRQDTQPPAYYLALTGWLHLGHDPASLRGLSVLGMVLVLPVLFDAARRLFGVRVALLAVLLFALGPGNAALAQRARPYALQTLFVAVGFWGFVRIWLGPPRPLAGWLAYVLGGGLAVLAQYPAVFFLLGCNLGMAARLGLAWRRGRWAAERRLAWGWVAAQGALWLVWLPWLPDGVAQVMAHLLPSEIAARHANFLTNPEGLKQTLIGLLAVPFLWRAQLPFAVLCGLIALAGIVALGRAGGRGIAVLATAVAPLLVCLLAWALLHPVFGYIIYTFLWLHMPYAILLAVGLLAVRPRWLGAAALALLLLGDAWGLANQRATRTEPLDQAAALIAADQRPGDGLVLSGAAATRWALAYYLGPPYAGHIDGLDISDVPPAGWPITTAAAARAHPRVWVVAPDAEPPAVDPASLAPAMTRALHQRFGDVTVDRYDRTP